MDLHRSCMIEGFEGAFGCKDAYTYMSLSSDMSKSEEYFGLRLWKPFT